MPKQTRADVEKSFVALARRYGGKVLFTMNQGDFKEYWEEHAGGKCNGISILWLRHQHSELQSRAFAFFDEKKNKMVQLLEVRYRELKERDAELWKRAQVYFDASEEDRKEKFSPEEKEIFESARHLSGNWRREAVLNADPFARALHQRMHVEGQINKYLDEDEEQARVNALFREYGMTFESSKVFAGGWGKGHTDLGKFVAKSGTASMLHSATHAMAACNTLGKPRFFDPNFGAVEFTSGGNLGSFLSAFFKIELVNTAYGKTKSYQKLRVKADRYHYEVNRVYTVR